MNKAVVLFLFVFHFSFCQKKCEAGTMDYIDFQTSYKVEKAPKIKDSIKDFVVVVLPELKQPNFVSFEENYAREEANGTDNFLSERFKHLKLTGAAEQEFYKKHRAMQLRYADSLHTAAESMDEVWLINKTNKSQIFLAQDGSPIMILEAQNENKEWQPITFWGFSGCGNSYHDPIGFKRNDGIRMRISLPKQGDFATKLRFKVNGLGKFYYSNVFDGKIDYCSFIDEPKKNAYPHDTLEELFSPY